MPPPTRGGNSKDVPHYVDSADYDPQPYYVDGVEYKPYVPDKKKGKQVAVSASSPVAQVSPTQQGAGAVKGLPQPELHPYMPTSVEARAEPAPAAPVQAAAATSSSSAVPYVQKKRPRYAAAIIEALDKVTAESVRFEAPIGQSVRYKGLIYLVKACETSADDEAQSDVFAYMQVRTSPRDATTTSVAVKSKEIFQGWMFSSSPSINPIQHPVYDAWVIGCRKPLGGAAS